MLRHFVPQKFKLIVRIIAIITALAFIFYRL